MTEKALHVNRAASMAWLAVFCCLLLAAPRAGHGASATVTPGSLPNPVSGVAVGIRWTVNAGNQNPGVPFQGINGLVVGVPSGTTLLTLPDTPPAQLTAPQATLTESVRIPASAVVRALRQGDSALLIRRDFSALGQTFDSGQAFVPISTGSAGALDIARLELRFADDSRSTIVEQQQRLSARADIHYTGKGVLQGVWEVAGPPSTLGDPVFQPLKLVRMPLLAGQQITLSVSDLPTHTNGLHFLRFRITSPTGIVNLPTIRYFVTRNASASRLPVHILAPAAPSVLDRDTVFSWRPVRNAHVYQVEFYAIPNDMQPSMGMASLEEINARRLLEGGAPLARETGLMVPGEVTRVSLSAMTREHLRSGSRYLWRVIAFDDQGRRLAESRLRPINVP